MKYKKTLLLTDMMLCFLLIVLPVSARQNSIPAETINHRPVSAGLSNVTIIDQNLSTTVTRDGNTLTIGYLIRNNTGAAVTVGLGFSLFTPGGAEVPDIENDQIITAANGENWYYRDFFINLPPQSQTGAQYDAIWRLWEIQNGNFHQIVDSNSLANVLTINQPVFVRIPVLVYHNVGDSAPNRYWVEKEEFRGQLKALKAYGYTPVTFQELMDERAGIQSGKKVIITFDDGKDNFLSHAYPVLSDSSINLKATHYIISGRVGKNGYLTWDQIRSMENSGLIDFQSHTVTHLDLVTLSDGDLNYQLLNSKEVIEQELSKDILYLSYPFGSYNSRVQMASHEAGYFSAIGAWGGVEQDTQDKWGITRVQVIWTTSVYYDKNSPGEFFMTKIGDPDVKVPVIDIGSVQFLDPVSNQPLPGNEVSAGDSVKIRLSASNSGENAPISATLQIDSDTNPDNGVIYDSHTANGDIVRTFSSGSSFFDWTWDVPQSAPQGTYYLYFKFYDHHYVLGFEFSGRRSGFTVDNTVQPASITLTSPNGNEAYIPGQLIPITWSTTGIVSDISIDYSTNGGQNWGPVADSLSDTGSFNWTAPDLTSNECLIRISGNNGQVTDSSDAAFSIGSTQAEDFSISVQNTRDGQTIQLGFQIDNPGSQPLSLGFDGLLVSPDGKVAKDPANRIIRQVQPGSHWVYTDYLVNLPPGAPVNSNYDVVWQVWTVNGDAFDELLQSNQNSNAVLIEPSVLVRIPVLMYHDVGETTPNRYWVRTDEFRAQMEALKAYGYSAITLQDLADERAGILAERKMMLTFDDGWVSMYQNAYPILSSEPIQYKFTNFIYTQAIGWSNYLSWDQIHTMHNSGLGDMQAHTVTHPHLTNLSDESIRFELETSKEILESELNKPVKFISYPYGDYDLRVQQISHEAGYFAGIAGWGGIEQNSSNKWAIKRMEIHWNVSVNYDKAHPENFFMSYVDPDFAVPVITMQNIQFLDPATDLPLPDNQVIPGNSVKIRVTAGNTGDAAPVSASLIIGSDANPGGGIIFDSHDTDPVQDITRTFPQGQDSFEWTWQVPAGTTPGQYFLQVDFRDPHHVFTYEPGEWMTAFQVGGSCTAPQITSHPASLTIGYNTTATLSAAASGSQPMSYQWYLGASGDETSPISGADTATLTTPTLTSITYFWVKVSNACGSAGSQTAVITVTAPPTEPGWTLQENLQYNMIVYGIAYSGNDLAVTGDWIGAFGPGGETDCRAVANIQADGRFYLTVGSDVASAEIITFKLWPLPNGPDYSANQSLNFLANEVQADQILTFGDSQYQQINLSASWNWISFNVLPEDLSFDAVLAGILSKVEYVKTQSRSAFRQNNQWFGDLTDMSDIARGKMFFIKISSAATLTVVGSSIGQDLAIPVVSGWNWIGYLPATCHPTATAMNSIIANLAQIKSQFQSAINNNGTLLGDLTEMCPGQGYSLQMNANDILDYSNGGLTNLLNLHGQPQDSKTSSGTPWQEIRGNRYNMISHGSVFINGETIRDEDYFLAVFGPGGEADCRAVRPLSAHGDFYTTILGNRSGEPLTFKLFNSRTGQVIESSRQKDTFQPDSVLSNLNLHFKHDSIPTNIDLNKQKLIFTATVGQQVISPKTVTIRTRGADSMIWTALSDRGWIQCTPLSGTGDGQVTVSVNIAGLTAGKYRGSLTVFDSANPDSASRLEIELILREAEYKDEMTGAILSPNHGVMGVSGNLPVSGWALSSTGVERVTIWRQVIPGEKADSNGLIYLGEADLIAGARPELMIQYPDYPGNELAGWGYTLLTNLLPQSGIGTYTIHARAEDVNGRTFDLGSRTFSCNNNEAIQPFGAIAVLDQVEYVPGQLVTSGWALSPVGLIPTDGSTIHVWINGIPVGHPEYGYAGADIDSLFPGYANSGAASGYFRFDTSKLPGGRHSVVWSVTDSKNNTAAIGTRYFANESVQSYSATAMDHFGKLSEMVAIPSTAGTIFLRTGYQFNVPAIPIQVDGKRIYTIETHETERMQIYFDENIYNDFKKDRPRHFNETASWKREFTRNSVLRGFLVIGDQLKPLPIGSTLDRINNTFHWQPGPGFIGEYHLLFIDGRAGKASKKHEITIKIRPQSFEVDSTH